MFKYFLLSVVVFLSACSSVQPIKPTDIDVPPPALTAANPGQIKCLDTLAAAKYGAQLKHVPVEYGVRGFAKKEFGDFYPVAKRELERGRPWVGVNLLWSDTHTFGDRDVPFVVQQAKRYEPLCQQYPGKIELATFTEHNLSNPDKYHDRVQAAAPSCKIVNSVYRGALSKKYKNEVHGSHAKPSGRYNYSYDGTNSVDSNVVKDLKTHSQAEVFCMWVPSFNLRYRSKDTANRDQRNREAADRSPNEDMLKSVAYLFSEPGPMVLPKGWLLKSHADKHDKNDTKGNKMLIISLVKFKNGVIQLKRDGKVIASLNYYGPFDGGGWRYYWNRFGYTAGSTLTVIGDGKAFGTVNGGFRTGNFRQ